GSGRGSAGAPPPSPRGRDRHQPRKLWPGAAPALIAVSRDRVPVPRHPEFAVRYRAAPAASDRSLTEPLQRFCVAWQPLVEHLVEQFRATLILDVLTHCLPRNVLHRSGLSLGAATQCLCFRV